MKTTVTQRRLMLLLFVYVLVGVALMSWAINI